MSTAMILPGVDRVAAAPPIDAAFAGLRPYQQAAVRGGIDALRAHRSAVIVLPTGTGKTRTAAYLVRRGRGRVLWLAHRSELLSQGREALEAMTGELVGLEQGPWRASDERIVVASVATVWQPRRLERFAPDTFSLIVCDEAHHFVSPGFRRILKHFSGAKVLGLTATPKRADQKALGLEFDAEAYVYGIDQAQADGWLVPFLWRQVVVDKVDLAKLKTSKGDFTDADLEGAMMDEEAIHGIAKPLLELGGDLRTLCYSPGVAHAQRLAEILNTYKPGSARVVHGETPRDERMRTDRAHKAGEFQYLCNCGIYTEGYDSPTVQCLAIARPTKSANLYTQIIGRGGRPIVAPPVDSTAAERREFISRSAKPACLIIDFTGNPGRHASSLVTPVDILGGRYDESVRTRAKKILERDGGDVGSALERAAQEEADAKKRRAARGAFGVDVKWSARDPFGALHMPAPADDGLPVSPVNLERLRDRLPKDMLATVKTDAQARRLLRIMGMRRSKGLATLKQVAWLARYGQTNPSISFERAKTMIDAIKRNGRLSLSPEQMDALSVRATGEEG